MQLKKKQIYDAKRAISRTIRLANHAVENPDHYGDEHAAEFARRKAFWATLDPEQRAEAIELLKRERADAVFAVLPDGATNALPTDIYAWLEQSPRPPFAMLERALSLSGVADLSNDAIAQAIATLEG